MSKRVEIKWNRPPEAVINETFEDADTLLFMGETWRRLCNRYVPFRTGIMADNVQTYVEGDEAVIHYQAPYANRQYNGDGFAFSKDKHPLACAHWDEAAKNAGEVDKLAKSMQAYIDRKG